MSNAHTTADSAVAHILRRICEDPRLAYLIGDGSTSFDLLTQAYAERTGEPVEAVRCRMASVKVQRVPPISVTLVQRRADGGIEPFQE